MSSIILFSLIGTCQWLQVHKISKPCQLFYRLKIYVLYTIQLYNNYNSIIAQPTSYIKKLVFSGCKQTVHLLTREMKQYNCQYTCIAPNLAILQIGCGWQTRNWILPLWMALIHFQSLTLKALKIDHKGTMYIATCNA